MASILIIDDDRLICKAISNVVKSLGHKCIVSFSLKNGIEKARSGNFDVVFLDVKMPDGSGLKMLPEILEAPSSPVVIIITGYGDPDGAELAIKNGAWDYIEKPAALEKIKLPLIRALQYREGIKSTKQPVSLKRSRILGNSQKIRNCLDIIAKAAASDANLLVTGETGSGKELFAGAVHENSSRFQKNFVVVDCAAIPETLVESVLFGHTKGAYTSADQDQEGLIKQADGGTLFLDEVGELPFSIQKKFLRVLQEHRFRPVGGDREVRSDFRLVAATNRDLEAMVKTGNFRDDLFFRLRSITVNLPPLREIREDIKELTIHYVSELSERYGKATKGFSPEIWEVFEKYHWPGNVRELIQALEQAVAAAQDEPVLFPQHLPTHIRIQVTRDFIGKKLDAQSKTGEYRVALKEFPQIQDIRNAAVEGAERKYLKDLVTFTHGNINKACELSGISKSRLYTLLKKYRLPSSQ